MKILAWMYILLGATMVVLIGGWTDVYQQLSLPMEETRWWAEGMPYGIKTVAMLFCVVVPVATIFLGVFSLFIWRLATPISTSLPKQCDCCGGEGER